MQFAALFDGLSFDLAPCIGDVSAQDWHYYGLTNPPDRSPQWLSLLKIISERSDDAIKEMAKNFQSFSSNRTAPANGATYVTILRTRSYV